MNIITLISDFGTSDWFVGTVKGVIHGVHPQTTVVDITHDIPAGDIRAGAFALMAAYRYFPHGTVHVAVVDPGVGGTRAAVVALTTDYIFVGPDNGLLSWALRLEKIRAIHRLDNDKFFLKPVSQTFHGRDVFAPVAAQLAKGLPLERLGPPHNALVRLPWPEPRRARQEAQGEVIYIDRFGNAITNLHEELLAGFERKRCRVYIRGKPVAPFQRFYQEVPHGKPAGIISSSGFLEIAVNGGSAAKKLKLKTGDAVLVSSARG